MSKYLFSLFFGLLIMSLPHLVAAQKKLKLVNSQNGKEIILQQGSRVQCVLLQSSASVVGILGEVTAESIKVDEAVIRLEDIKAIGRKKKGSTLGSLVLASFGGAMIGSFLAPEPDPCPSCTTVIVEDHGGSAGDALLMAGGAAMIGFGLHTAIRNSPKPLKTAKWQVEVVD